MPHPPLRSRPTSAGSTQARPSSAGRERSAVPTVSRGKDKRTDIKPSRKNSTSPMNISRLSHPGGGYLAFCFYCCAYMNNNGVDETTK